MKKMLLLLVSGLLIACMAGSALASNTVLDPDEIIITPDGTTISDASLTMTLGNTLPANFHVELSTTEGVSAYIESSDPIALGSSSLWANSVDSLVGNQFTVAKKIDYKGILHVKGTQAGQVTVWTFTDNGNIHKTYSVETADVSVPEFPTVALPVAAMLGLLFVFGRKKEGL